MIKLVVSKDRNDYIKKLIDIFNVINETKISKSELNLLLEIMYGVKNRLNNKVKEEARIKLTEKGLLNKEKVSEFLYDLFSGADDKDFEYIITFRLEEYVDSGKDIK